MGLHHLADRPVGRPQDLERHKSRVGAAQFSETAAAGSGEEALMHAQRRSEGFDKRWDFFLSKIDRRVWHEGTKRHRPPWEEALSGSSARQCTVRVQKDVVGLIHALY